MSTDTGGTPEVRARRRVEERNGLFVHIAAYVLVNAFLWIQDATTGDGIEWAYWTTIPWGIGLLIHIAVYVISTGRMNDRAYERFLAEERARDERLNR